MTARYINVFRVPKSVGPGRVLCHNHVQHTRDMPCGLNGFRAWTDTKPPKGFIRCPCGWSGLPHYALRQHVKATRGKCKPGSMGAMRIVCEESGRAAR
ncbi:hypothetical protein ABIE89_006953 [Bradyrhizobium niftali]